MLNINCAEIQVFTIKNTHPSLL